MPRNTTAQLPIDKDSIPIQALSPVESTVAQLTIGATTSSIALPANAEIVEVTAQDVCRMAFGLSGVEASAASRLVLAGTSVYKVPAEATHIACIRVGSSSGAISITKLV